MFSVEYKAPPPGSLVVGHRQAQRARLVTCGATSTYIVACAPFNTTYLCGVTKKSGEVCMQK